MNKTKILLVEDEVATARDFMTNLINFGYEVVDIVDNGVEAVRVTSELRPDLVLMDITLLGPMSAMQAAGVIWQSHQMPIIFLTGHADIVIKDGDKQSKPFAYLPKSCTLKKLVSTIEMAIGKNTAAVSPSQVKTALKRIRGGVAPASERRRHPRYRAGEGAMAFTVNTPGRIQDISLGGISFVYVDNPNSTLDKDSVSIPKRAAIDIMDRREGFFLEAILYRLVTKKTLINESPFSMTRMVHCAVAFESLTEPQQTGLEVYIHKQSGVEEPYEAALSR